MPSKTQIIKVALAAVCIVQLVLMSKIRSQQRKFEEFAALQGSASQLVVSCLEKGLNQRALEVSKENVRHMLLVSESNRLSGHGVAATVIAGENLFDKVGLDQEEEKKLRKYVQWLIKRE